MKHRVLIDTNVLIDVLSVNRPLYQESSAIFNGIRKGLFEGYLVTQSIVDASYVLSKEGPTALSRLKEAIQDMRSYINFDNISSFDIDRACRSDSTDFEDDVIFSRAIDCACDIIVTSDKNFRKRHEGEDRFIRFFTPGELIDAITTG